jgi:PKD repeat protein
VATFRQGRRGARALAVLLAGAGALLAPAIAFAAPTASFTLAPSAPETGQATDFTSTSTDDTGTIEEYEWVIDGEYAGSQATLVHTFDYAGSHEVSLSVYDDEGDSDTAIQTVEVTEAYVPPPEPALAEFPGEIVLGSRSFLPTGGRGWGTPHPRTIFNGGVPSGLVRGIHWTGWGSPSAIGIGHNPTYKPQGGYYGRALKIKLKATDVGQCPGETQQAYLTLEFRARQWPGGPLGPWTRWSGVSSLCDYSEKDPRYDYPARPPGYCKNVGEGYSPGQGFSVQAYRVGCSRARAVARAANRRLRPASRHCVRHGCTKHVQGFRCHAARVHTDEQSPDIDGVYPVQRVACRRGGANVSWWLVLDWD